MITSLQNKKVTIYTLSMPDTDYVFYVGRTTMTLKERLCCHLSPSANVNPRLRKILHDLDSKNMVPEIDEVDVTTYDKRKDVEEYWIQQFSSWGFQLANVKHNKTKGRQKKIFSSSFSKEEKGLINTLYRNGDNTAIAKIVNVSPELIRISKRSRRCNTMIREAIVSFYMERARIVSELHDAWLTSQFIKAA